MAGKPNVKQVIHKLVSNPLYEAVVHSLINLAAQTVHNPDSKEYLQIELQPLKDALDDLYREKVSPGQPVA